VPAHARRRFWNLLVDSMGVAELECEARRSHHGVHGEVEWRRRGRVALETSNKSNLDDFFLSPCSLITIEKVQEVLLRKFHWACM
jgi:hypothetical protein